MTFQFEKERVTAVSPEGRPMGFIVFPQVRTGLVNISQIMTYPAFRGQGVDNAMMEALLSYLERNDQKAALTSPFAQQYLEKNPKWKHILPGEMHFTTH